MVLLVIKPTAKLITKRGPHTLDTEKKFLITYSKSNLQRAKKVASDSPGLVDFDIGLVFFVLNLPDGQVLFFGEIQITERLLSILPIKKGFGAG